jgi:hypothetical protein
MRIREQQALVVGGEENDSGKRGARGGMQQRKREGTTRGTKGCPNSRNSSPELPTETPEELAQTGTAGGRVDNGQ